MLNNIRLFCKNADSGCLEVIPYEGLEKHEITCKQCLLCKVQCLQCNEVYLPEEAH